MGASASTVVEEQLDEEIDPCSWLALHFVTDDGVHFNSVSKTIDFILYDNLTDIIVY